MFWERGWNIEDPEAGLFGRGRCHSDRTNGRNVRRAGQGTKWWSTVSTKNKEGRRKKRTRWVGVTCRYARTLKPSLFCLFTMDFFLFAISAETVTPRNVSTAARLACQLLPETRHSFFLSLLLRHHFNCRVEMQWASCTPSWKRLYRKGGRPLPVCCRVGRLFSNQPLPALQACCPLVTPYCTSFGMSMPHPCPLPRPGEHPQVQRMRLIARVPAYSSVINRQKPLPFFLILLGQMRRLALPPPPETAQFASHM